MDVRSSSVVTELLPSSGLHLWPARYVCVLECPATEISHATFIWLDFECCPKPTRVPTMSVSQNHFWGCLGRGHILEYTLARSDEFGHNWRHSPQGDAIGSILGQRSEEEHFGFWPTEELSPLLVAQWQKMGFRSARASLSTVRHHPNGDPYRPDGVWLAPNLDASQKPKHHKDGHRHRRGWRSSVMYPSLPTWCAGLRNNLQRFIQTQSENLKPSGRLDGCNFGNPQVTQGRTGTRTCCSNAFSVPPLIIFFLWRRFKSERTVLHRNLGSIFLQ